ncbi:MAG: hypothetical protein AB7U75_14850 [Hyphomicrobiaceae bacterium]
MTYRVHRYRQPSYTVKIERLADGACTYLSGEAALAFEEDLDATVKAGIRGECDNPRDFVLHGLF